MKAFSVMVFLVCLNMSAFILNQSEAIPGTKELWINPFDVTNQFSLTVLGALTMGAIGGGIIALIFRQNIFAIGALLVFVISTMIPIVQWFLLGTPLMLAALLPSELSYLSAVIGAFFAITFFMFLMSILGQRQIE